MRVERLLGRGQRRSSAAPRRSRCAATVGGLQTDPEKDQPARRAPCESFEAEVNFAMPSRNHLLGRIIPDLGCMRGCDGIEWALHWVKEFEELGRVFPLKPSSQTFRFGDGMRRNAKPTLLFEGGPWGTHHGRAA